MKDVFISVDEIPAKKGDNPYKISNDTYLQIYNFYANGRHSQAERYVIKNGDYYKIDVVTNDFATYRRVGIYFQDDVIDNNREFILFLKSDSLQSQTALEKEIQKQKESIGCDGFSFLVIEKVYGYRDSREKDNALIRSILPDITIINEGFPRIEKVLSTLVFDGKTKYLDIAPLMNEFFFCTNSSVSNIKHVSMLCNAIEKTIGKYDVYCCDESKLTEYNRIGNQSFRGTLGAIAAYLTLAKGLNFDLALQQEIHVLRNVSKFVSRDYNYLDDYLKFVKNPLNFGLFIKDDNIYFCIKNVTAMQRSPYKYKHTIGLDEVNFDLETCQIIETQSSSVSYDLDSIELLSIEEVFQLTGKDWDAAHSGLFMLDKCLVELEKILNQKKSIGENETLGLTNVLLFRVNGVCKIGYVQAINGMTPYIINPVDSSFSSFNQEFSVQDYSNILDCKIASDSARWVEAFTAASYISGSNIHYDLPRHARGILFSDIRANSEILCDLKDVCTFEEIGVWYPALVQFRGGYAKQLFDYVIPSAARNTRLITYYGGPFTYKSSNIVLNPKCWK